MQHAGQMGASGLDDETALSPFADRARNSLERQQSRMP
jgi:hypothetical protein